MLMLEAALSYAALGWRVFPLQPRSKVPPHGFKWQREHAPNEEVIRAWWTTWPDANIGIATGSASGFWCLDVDPRNGGDDSLDQLIAEIGKLPDTVEALTGGGGRHILFLCTGAPIPCGKLGPGLDVKGDGGYIVAHPSIHPDTGNAYEWEASSSPFDGVAIAAAPAALLERLTPNERSAAPVASPGADLPIPQGMRDNALTSLAGSLRRLGMGPDAIAGVLHAENLRRCQPPLHDKDIERIARSVARYAPGADYAATAHGAQVAQALATSTAPPADRFRLLSFADVASLPVEPSRIKGILPSRGVAALYGPSKSGKSFLSMHQAIHIVNGWEWFGYRTRPAPVVYCVLEGESGIPKRTRALESRFGKPERLRFIIEPWSLLNASDVEALIHVIKMTDAGNGVVYIDTLARAATGEENTSEYGAAVLDACQRIYSATGSLVILVAHTGKDAARGLRGHTSIFAGLDAAIEVTRDASGRSWSIAKAKDDEDETAHAFRLDVVNLGTDEDGDPITSCVVVPTEGAAAAVARPRPPSGGNQKIIWDALGELFKNSTHHGQGGAPETRAAIRLEEAITKTRTRLPCPSDRQTERARQALTGLISRGILAHQDGWIWCA